MKSLYSIIILLALTTSFSQTVQAKKQGKEQQVAATQQSKSSINVNINSANAETIAEALKGVGMKKAQAIIEYRKKHGDFKAIEEIASVKGIGAATIAKNFNRIKLK